ncbi:MAG: serine/threonine-protein kinase [Anaerosomatales bacterium]|nr:serine/threonine-protein kinase [Anaerosomatales bacterium]
MEEPLILDRYRPLAELGAGGHGTVVLGFDTRMARRVAIKRLPLGTKAKPAGLAEARTAAMLNHPEIVTVHEWDSDEHAAYLVMEHIDGLSLAELLDAIDTPLDADEAAAVVGALARAIGFAHENGVLHLDIKPQNVLITRDGRVKVADFGVAALTDVTGRARSFAGTIGYMPPEQIRSEPVDERTDEWAFAALAYEALTLALPFDSESAEGSLFRIEHADMPAPSEFEPSLGPGIDTVLLAALAPEPEERYQSATEFAAALLDHLGDAEAGRESLAELVSSLAAEEDGGFEPGASGLGLWDRLARWAPVARRAWAAALCGWLAWAGLGAFSLEQAALLGATALVALAAAIVPALGLALGLGAFAAGLFATDLAGGIVFLVMAGAVWAWAGRRGEGDSLLPATAPALGVARLGLAAPLLAGYVFGPARAAVSGAASAVALMAASAATGGRAPYLAVDPAFFSAPWDGAIMAANLRGLFAVGPLVAALAWAGAGAIASLLCARGTRGGAVAGIVLGAAALGLGYLGWQTLAGGGAFDVDEALVSAGASAMLLAAVIAAGPPTRGE